MSTDTTTGRPKHPRPSVVTLACVFVAVTAFLTLTEVISALMDWGTVDMQKAVQPALRRLEAAGLDVSTTQLLVLLRWFGLAMVPFSVSALVFSIYTMRGDRTARVMTSILAVAAGVVSLPIGVFGILQAAMLFVAAGALWSPDAKRWFRGEPGSSAVKVATPSTSSGVEATSPGVEAASPGVEGASPGVEAASSGVEGASSVVAVTTRPARPTSVMTAGLITILGSLAAAAFASLYLAVHTFARADYIEAVQSGPFAGMITAKELELMMTVTFWASVVIIPLALAGLLGAAALLARRRVGRTATLVWAWATAALGLVMLPVGLLATAGAGAVIVLLFRDDARQWTSSHNDLR